MQLTVITATWQRPQQLATCLQQVQSQSTADLEWEHLVVSDGVDPIARRQAVGPRVRYLERPKNGGKFGAYAKDDGVRAALGEYVCFWDDDNWYFPHALATLYAAVVTADVGLVRVEHLDRTTGRRVLLPRCWNGQPKLGDIDTLNFCVRRSFALQEQWADCQQPRGTDFDWIRRIFARSPATQYVPLVVGRHVLFF